MTTLAHQQVEYSAQDGIAEIALNRPESSNAIDLATAIALSRAIDQAQEDPDVRAVLLHGKGRRFCGGGDLAAMARAPDRAAFVGELADAAHAAILALNALEKPVVVAVQGAAAGVGLSFLLSADVVVAGESAKFVTAYTSVGLTPDGGLSWLLPRVVGQLRAAELILLSRPVPAEAAATLGLVSEVCADPDVLRRAREHAVALAERPPQALAEARRLVRAAWDRNLTDHLADEAATIARVATADTTGSLIAAYAHPAR